MSVKRWGGLNLLLAAFVTGCVGGLTGPIPAAEAPAPPFEDCRADSYDFAGEATLAGLGLVGTTPADLPEPNRPAKIWVTHETIGDDPPGVRSLCFEFDDGSGGSDWPVNADWRPPGALPAAGSTSADDPSPLGALALVTTLAAAVVVGSLLAFRRR